MSETDSVNRCAPRPTDTLIACVFCFLSKQTQRVVNEWPIFLSLLFLLLPLLLLQEIIGMGGGGGRGGRGGGGINLNVNLVEERLWTCRLIFQGDLSNLNRSVAVIDPLSPPTSSLGHLLLLPLF